MGRGPCAVAGTVGAAGAAGGIEAGLVIELVVRLNGDVVEDLEAQ